MKSKSFPFKIALVLLFAFLFSIAGCAPDEKPDPDVPTNGAEDRYGGVLQVAVVGDVTDFDPILYTGTLHISTLALIYDTLIRIDSADKPQPGIAREWDYLNDLTLRLYLEEGVTFHDGTVLDADVVKFNIERMNSEESRLGFLDSVISVEVVDELTVDLHLSSPDSLLLHALASQGGMMVSPESVGDVIGAGPYKLSSHEPLYRLVLERNDSYWMEGLPYLDEIVLTIIDDPATRTNSLEAGEIHISDVPIQQRVPMEARETDVVFSDAYSNQFGILALNTAIEPFGSADVRKAISLAIDREDFVAVLRGKGKGTAQFYPPGHWAHNPDVVPQYDPEKAKELLEGYDNLTFDLYVIPAPGMVMAAEIIQEHLKQIGIEVNIVTQELMSNTEGFEHEKRIGAYLTIHPGSPHPLMAYDRLLVRLNPGGWSNDQVSDLIAMARSAATIEEQQEYNQDIARLLYEEQCNIITLWRPLVTGAYHASVQGLHRDFSMLGNNYMFAWLEK